ncbi:MAG: hypothetical protein IVW54_09275 [Candidatus Binataceae bacterium]|nr:hypothetical protein [Candidatus Binataceae bacterium]
MTTLIDNAEFTADEVYEIQATDTVEGAATGASFGGIGISNQPHQQLANRTALLKQRQDTNLANISALQTFTAQFRGSLQGNGYLEIPIIDVARGAVVAIIQWGYYSLPATKISGDTQYSVVWPIPFPNAILLPPLATNVYAATGGENTVASVISYGTASAVFVLDVPNGMVTAGGQTVIGGNGPEKSNGFSWLAIGF